MNQPANDWERRLDELVSELENGNISESQSAELARMLESQSGARRRFAERMHLSAVLSDGIPSAEEIKMNNPASPSHRAPRGYRAVAMVLLATSATLACLLFWPKLSGGERELFDGGVAVVTQAYDATWDGESQLRIGSSVSPGTVKLKSGLIQLEFYRGAVVVVEGPAVLEFVDADNLICRHGRLQ